jgi:hypothetical protein
MRGGVKSAPWTLISIFVAMALGAWIWLSVSSRASSLPKPLEGDAASAGLPSPDLSRPQSPKQIIDSVRDTVKSARERLNPPSDHEE